MVVVTVRAQYYVRPASFQIERLAIIILDWILLDEVTQRSKFGVWVSRCAAATGVDQDDDRIINLCIYEGELPVLVGLDDAECGRVQPGAGEACRWTVVAVSCC